METHIPFDLLQGLVDVPGSSRSPSRSALEERERLHALSSVLHPHVGIDRPHWDVREHDDPACCSSATLVTLQPVDLLSTEQAESAGFQIHGVPRDR